MCEGANKMNDAILSVVALMLMVLALARESLDRSYSDDNSDGSSFENFKDISGDDSQS
jgi:hypothetical protein